MSRGLKGILHVIIDAPIPRVPKSDPHRHMDQILLHYTFQIIVVHKGIQKFTSMSNQACPELNPPSTTMSAPVVYAAASVSKQATMPLRSPLVPTRCSGGVVLNDFQRLGSFRVASRIISVAIKPGDTELTRIPNWASSTASDRVRDIIAPFEAE